MTFLMLFSSVGFSLDVHYCGGGIKDVSFFGKANECEMMKEVVVEESHACCTNKSKTVVSHCSKNSSDELLSKGKCCSNESFMLQSIEDGQTSDSYEMTSVNLTFITLFILNKALLFETESNVVNYSLYRPPLIYYDAIIQHQSFLI